MATCTMNHVKAFRETLAIGQTKTFMGFTVHRESLMVFHVTHLVDKGTREWTERLIGIGTMQDYIVREANRKPHNAGKESFLPERLRPM